VSISGLQALLRPERLTEIVDVGANPIDGDPPYKAMLGAGLCRVTGFEPQGHALQNLLQKKGPLERYFPWAIGDGQTHELKLCVSQGMTSFLEPDPAALATFEVFRELGTVRGRVAVPTRRLDDIAEIAAMDFLKIDIQGSELMVFRNAGDRLGSAVAVQTEISFVNLYLNQPTAGEIDLELRRHGLIPHCFAAVKCWPIAPCVVNGNPRQPLNQLLEADIVYVRDFTRAETMTAEQLKHLALIAVHCYGSVDLALRCIATLEGRHDIPRGSQQAFLESFSNP